MATSGRWAAGSTPQPPVRSRLNPPALNSPVSYQENVDTTTPQGELVFGMMASLAQFESSLIGERVRAGMARAKAQGKRTSRPPIPAATKRKIEELARKGTSINGIAKALRIAYGTAWNYVKAVER